MPNTLLTPDMILRDAGRIFHQKAVFINAIDRQYDDAFARTGAKIGNSVRLRRRNQYSVTDGPTMVAQDTFEESDTLTISRHKHIAVNFGMQELALSLDDFSARILEPAMATLAAAVEADVLSNVTKDVHNLVDGDASAFAFIHLAEAKRVLDDNLAPPTERTALLSTAHQVKWLDSTKGLFNAQPQISKQLRDGSLGNLMGFDVMPSTIVSDHTTGTAAKSTGYTVNGATQSGSAITVQSGSATFKRGDVVTFAGANRVHPETKADTGRLHQFVVTEDYAGGAGQLKISPALVPPAVSAARANVTGYPTNGGAVVKVGAGNGELLNGSLAFHQNAFVFATADLPDPSEFGAWGTRKTIDGIRFSIAKQFDILNYKIPCRIDIIYGFKTRYPELAARIHADG